MKSTFVVFLLALCAGQASGAKTEVNPLQKVVSMLSSMQQELIEGGEKQHHAYEEFSNMCENRARELQHETKVAAAELDDLKATINKANDDESEADSAIEDISGKVSTSETDLKASTLIREREATEFVETQKDLLDTISKMQRAISIISKQQKGGASFAQEGFSIEANRRKQQEQTDRATALSAAFAAIVDASVVSSADSDSLASMLQTSDEASDGDAQLDDAADSYTGQQKGNGNSASIVETMNGLLDKAEAALEGARSKESKSGQNYLLFKGSLERKLAVDSKELAGVKKDKAEAGQNRAEAEGDLEVVKKNLAEDKKSLDQLHHACMGRAADFEDETKGRDEELKAVGEAKKIIKEMTGDAGKQTYDLAQVSSFLQTKSRRNSGTAASNVAQMMRQLGEKFRVRSFVQMSHKMEQAISTSAISGGDPFVKVKEMLTGMISKLGKQMQNEATHKVYCDKEMKETSKHKAEKDSLVDKISTKIDTQTSRSMNLKRQIAETQKELLENMETQKEVDQIRNKEHATFVKLKPQMEMGLEGIKKALSVLREYYAKDDGDAASFLQQGGSGGGVISMLEVCESDFSKGLAEMIAGEETEQAEYEEQTHENNLAKAIKDQDVVFKTKTAKSLDKSTSESSTDLDGVQTELDAINEYWAKIQEECVAKPDTYEERRKRHMAMLDGLKNAQTILSGGALFLQ